MKLHHIVTHTRTNEAGEVEFLGTAMDVTAFKQIQSRLQASLEEKDALLKEVHHRVKNNLQLINSLLSLQAARIPDRAVAELFAESRNRVRSMALVHENLYRAGNFARIAMRAHIQNLAAHLIRAYGCRLGISIDDRDRRHRLDLDRAVSIGLIIRAGLNAFKHAFPASPSGSLRAGPCGWISSSWPATAAPSRD
jgi:two-component sensor histidine kinase